MTPPTMAAVLSAGEGEQISVQLEMTIPSTLILIIITVYDS